MKRKYPASLFWMGVLQNLIKRFWMLFSSIVLLIVGVWVEICLAIGGGLMILWVLAAIVEQLYLRHHTLKKTDDPEFAKWQDLILSDDWNENVRNEVEQIIREGGVAPDLDDEDEPKDDDDENPFSEF